MDLTPAGCSPGPSPSRPSSPFLFVGAVILQLLALVVSLSFACMIRCVSFSIYRGMKTCDTTVQGQAGRAWIRQMVYPAKQKQTAQLPSHCRGKGAMLWHPRLGGSSAVITMCLTSHCFIATALFWSGKGNSLCLGQSVLYSTIEDKYPSGASSASLNAFCHGP